MLSIQRKYYQYGTQYLTDIKKLWSGA